MKVLRLYSEALSRAGIDVLGAEKTGGGHFKLTVAPSGDRSITASLFVASTPGDHRAVANTVTYARRNLREAAERWNGGKYHQ